MRQDPGFDVNMDRNIFGVTLLHVACYRDSRSAVIPLLPAHPDIDVSVKNEYGQAPFLYACGGSPSCVREMLKDSRVKVNEPDNDGCTPLWSVAANGQLDVIKWWIASGREMDLGMPGDDATDAIGAAKMYHMTEVVTLLERFKSDATQTRHAVRVELGLLDELAAEMFARWSLSRMGYCKSRTPLQPHLRPGSSILPPSFLWNSKWWCSSSRWDQTRRSSQGERAKWHSKNWQGDSDDPPMEPTSLSQPPCPGLRCEWMSPSTFLHSFPEHCGHDQIISPFREEE